MKLSAMDGVLGQEVSTVFQRAKSLGLEGVEVNLKIKPLMAGEEAVLHAAVQASDETGVRISSAVLGEHNSGGLATWWRGAEADAEVRRALEACQTLGCRDLLVPFFFFNEPRGRTHRAAVCERIKPLAVYAESVGVRFCFEGVNRAEEMLEMIALVDSSAFGIYYDPANATWCDQDIVASVKLLSGRLFRTHVKEAKVFTGDSPLGEGRVDHAGYARALKSIGYDDWYTLETPGGTDEQVMRDMTFARKVYG